MHNYPTPEKIKPAILSPRPGCQFLPGVLLVHHTNKAEKEVFIMNSETEIKVL
jgi:hypothetical protein